MFLKSGGIILLSVLFCSSFAAAALASVVPASPTTHRPVPASSAFTARTSIPKRRFSFLDKILPSRSKRSIDSCLINGDAAFPSSITDTAKMSASTGALQTKGKFSWKSILLSTWGVSSVLLFMGNAIKRLLPVAIQPITAGDFTNSHWAAYIAWTVFMLYTEGYKAFHKKFSPLVVKRAFLLEQNLSPLNFILAGPFCMGMFHATKARMIVSWAINVGVIALVFIVKRLPYPWRSIIDAGVVAGLSVGSLSMLYYYVRTLAGHPPDIDSCMPAKKEL